MKKLPLLRQARAWAIRALGGKSAWDDYWYLTGPGAGTSSGKNVDADVAQTCSTVLACLRVLTETVAMLPLHVFQRLPNGDRLRAPEHPMYRLLHTAPNKETTKFTWCERIMLDLPLQGWSFTQIVRTVGTGRVLSLWPLQASRMTVKRNDSGELIYVYKLPNGKERIFQRDEIMAICGPMGGKSLISLAREGIGLALAMEERGAGFFARDARPGGVLSVTGALAPEKRKAMGKAWNEVFQGSGNSWKTVVLEEDTKWQSIEVNNNDAEFLASRKFQRSDIAGWFRVPPHMVGDLERATFTNIEHQGLEFTTHTMNPWLKRIEEALQQSFFPTERYYAKFNTDAIMRGDAAARAAYHTSMLNNGSMNRNEVRELEDLNKMPGKQGEIFTVQSAMVDLELVAENGTGVMPPPAPPPPAPEPEGEEEAGRAQWDGRRLHTPHTRASASTRLNLRETYRSAFRKLGEAIVKAEVEELRQRIGDIKPGVLKSQTRDAVEDFKTWLYDYYEERLSRIKKDSREVFEKYAKEVGLAAANEVETEVPDLERFIDEYAEGFATRHIIKSRAQLRDLESLEDIEQRLTDWETDKPDDIAAKELVMLGAAVAALVFFTAGRRIVWQTIAGACPLCLKMKGKTVGYGEDFLPAGGTVDPGDDKTTPLKVSTSIPFPPLHNGCNCYPAPIDEQ